MTLFTLACRDARVARARAQPIRSRAQEYKQLKERILTTARKAGAGLAAYLLLTVDGEAGLCALLGMAANNLYLSLLFRDVDAFTGETRVPMREAEQVRGPL